MDLNTCSSATKAIRPSQSFSPLAGPTPQKSNCSSAGEERVILDHYTPINHWPHLLQRVTQVGHDSNLLLKSLKKHLNSAPTLPIHPPPLKIRFKRVPFAEYYGGSYQHFLQFIPANRNPSGNTKRNLVFPQPLHNPALPVRPGEPGLIFASRHEVADGSPWSLFVKRDPSVALWTYFGDYKGEVCGQLTSGQFKTLSKSVRRAINSIQVFPTKVNITGTRHMGQPLAHPKIGHLFKNAD